MILAIIESKSAGMVSPSLTPGVDTDTRTRRQVEHRDPAGCGRKITIRIFGVQACFDRVTTFGGRVPSESIACGHLDLSTHQVDAGSEFGDRMFHLQTGIDLQESEQFVTGVIQEFDGGGTGVTDGDGEPFGRFA